MELIDLESVGIIKSLLFLLLPFLIPDEGLEEWLKDDGFRKGVEKDGSKKYLFIELEKLKNRLLYDAHDKTIINDKEGNNLNPIEIYNLLEAHKNRIRKVRLMIDHDVSIAHNTHKPSGQQYVVARTYWIDKNGKKFKKFSKNIGLKEKVYQNGKIPDHIQDPIKKELEQMMWKQYREEYPNE